MAVYSLEEIKNRLIPIFCEYGVNKAIVFGSYAKGSATPASDVDIVVDCSKRGLAFYGIISAIENRLDMECDVFRLSSIKPNSSIYDEISSTGVVIYEN